MEKLSFYNGWTDVNLIFDIKKGKSCNRYSTCSMDLNTLVKQIEDVTEI